MAELTEQDRQILAFEARFYRLPGAKVSAMLTELGLSEIAYYQRLSALVDTPEALAADPVLVNRLLRLRASRRRNA